MLMEAHEALMASNAWLVARLKAVEVTPHLVSFRRLSYDTW